MFSMDIFLHYRVSFDGLDNALIYCVMLKNYVKISI